MRTVTLLAATVASISGLGTMAQERSRSPADGGVPMAPYRCPDITLRQEFEAAKAARTAEALALFIARHPGSPMAKEAEALLAARQGGASETD